MNRLNKISKKIDFVIKYWKYIAKGNFDISSELIILDINSVILQLDVKLERFSQKVISSTSNRKIRDNCGLCYVSKEFINLSNKSILFQNYFSVEMNEIKDEILTLNFFNDITNISKIDQQNLVNGSISKIRNLIAYIKQNINYELIFFYLLDNIYNICLNNSYKSKDIKILKYLIMEAIQFGKYMQMSESYLEDIFYNFNFMMRKHEGNLCKQTTKIQIFGMYLKQREFNDITYIFSLNNLKILRPIHINDVFLYNPLRPDILYRYNSDYKILEEDKYILLPNEQIVFTKEFDHNIKEDLLEASKLVNTHARITVSALNYLEGYGKAKRKLVNTLETFEFLYNTKNDRRLTISREYATVMKNEKLVYSQPLCRDVRDFSQYIEQKFISEGVENDISITDSELNKYIKLNNKDIIQATIHYYLKARYAELQSEKLLNYYIAVETILIEQNGNSNFTRVNRILKEVVAMNIFKVESLLIIDALKVCFKQENRKSKDLNENYSKFVNTNDYKYLEKILSDLYSIIQDDLYKSKIQFLLSLLNSNYKKKRLVENFIERYSFCISNIYSYRNNIVHFGLYNEFNMKEYLNILEISVQMLIKSIINEIKIGDTSEEIESKLITLAAKYSQWEQTLCL